MTLFGCPSGDFDGVDDIATLDDVEWLDGATAYTLLLDLQHGQTALRQGFFRIAGTATGPDGDGFLTVRQAPTSFLADPAVANLYFATQDTLIAAVNTNCQLEGEAFRIFTVRPTCFALAWESGTAQEMVSDGRTETEVARTVATPTGTLVVPSGPLTFGAGPRAYWRGTLGLCRIAKTKRSGVWLVAEQRNRLDYRGVVAQGAMKAPADTVPCIAYPVTADLPTVATVYTPLTAATGTGLTIFSAIANLGTAVVNADGLSITYTPPTPASEVAATITFTILDAQHRHSSSRIRLEATPLLTIAADITSINEGDTGTTPITFTVTRTGNLGFASTVNWEVDLTTITIPNPVVASDFVGGVVPGGTLSWAVGEIATQTITCNMQGDLVVEGDKILRIRLKDPVNARLDATFTAATILVDEDAPDPGTPLLSISADLASINEGNAGTTPITFQVSRTVNTTGTSSCVWSVDTTVANSVVAADFVGGSIPTGATLTWTAGQDNQVITCNMVGDTVVEADKNLRILLSSPVNANIGTATATTILIDEDDAVVTPRLDITATAASVNEGASGTTPITFTVTRSVVTTGTSSCVWSVDSTVATPVVASDFVGGSIPAGATLTWTAGATTQTITCNMQGDLVVEADKNLRVRIASPVNANIGTATATTLLVDEDVSGPTSEIPAPLRTITVTTSAELRDNVLGLGSG